MPEIILQSNDNVDFKTDIKVACMSETIKNMINDLGYSDEDASTPIPLPNISSTILKKVLEWAEHHKDDQPITDDDDNKEKRTDDIPTWDAEFLKVEQSILFEYILAANYLDIKGLLDVN